MFALEIGETTPHSELHTAGQFDQQRAEPSPVAVAVRLVTTTRYPCLASNNAFAAPIPRLAPVIRATRFIVVISFSAEVERILVVDAPGLPVQSNPSTLRRLGTEPTFCDHFLA